MIGFACVFGFSKMCKIVLFRFYCHENAVGDQPPIDTAELPTEKIRGGDVACVDKQAALGKSWVASLPTCEINLEIKYRENM